MTQHNSKSCISKQIKSTSQQKLPQQEDNNVTVHFSKKRRKYTKQDIACISHRLYASSNRSQIERKKRSVDLSNAINTTNVNNDSDTNCILLRRNNVRHLDSSVAQSQRQLSPFATRDLSYSPKQAMLNEKSRLMKMPWKYKKNGIDNNESIDDVYKRYKDKVTKREHSRIINLKQYNHNTHMLPCNTMTTATLTGKPSFSDKTHGNNMTVKRYIKQFHQDRKRVHNGMELNDSYNKTYEPLSKPLLSRHHNNPIRTRTNTYFCGNSNNSNTSNMNTSISVVINSNKNDTLCKKTLKQVLPALYEGPIDLSCIMHCVKTVDECVEYVRKRMDLYKMQYYVQDKKGLKFYCTKNGVHFDIEIKRICGKKKGEWMMYLKVRERQRIFGSCKKIIEDILG